MVIEGQNLAEVIPDAVVRGDLESKKKKKRAGDIGLIRKSYIKLRSKSRQYRKLERKIIETNRRIRGLAKQQAYYHTLGQGILPATIQEFDTHAEFNKKILARSFILGLPTTDIPSFPPDLSSNTFNEFQNVSGNARVMLSTKICKIDPTVAENSQAGNWTQLQVEAEKTKLYNPGGAVDPGVENKIKAVKENFDAVWNRAENSFNTQTIVTIKGNAKDVLNAESKIWTKCSRDRISKRTADYNQLRAWNAANLSPFMDAGFTVEAPSPVAACLVAATNINTLNDDTGVLFAKNRATGADVIFDPRKLGAFHGVWFGATRSGKTFSSHTFMMRLKDMLDFHIVYMSRKEPDRRPGAVTDYEAVANFYQEEAATVILGETNHSINPLHVLANHKKMKPSDANKVWDDYRRGTSLFFKSWFDNKFESNFEGMLEDTLDSVYGKKKIYRDQPKSWLQPMPTITDCRNYWKSIFTDKEGQTFEDRRTAAAFWRKTRNAKPGGSMEYLLGDENGRTSFDLSKEWLTIALHKVDTRIQEALYILLSTALSVYYNADTSRETLIFIDEARALLRDKEMSSFILDTVTMGGTKGVGLALGTQQPADLIKSGNSEELRTNMFWAVVMGYGLDKESVKYVQQYFGLSDGVIEDLRSCKQGEGIFIKNTPGGEEVTPVRFEAIPLERMILENEYKEDTPETVSGYRIKEAFLKPGINGKNFLESNGFWLKECLDIDLGDKEAAEAAEAAVITDGWYKHNITWVTGGRGSTNMYYKPGDLDFSTKLVTRKGYGSMSIRHLSTQLQICVLIINRGKKADIFINNKPDIIFEWYSKKDNKMKVGCIEVEMPGSHTKEELIEKWGRMVPYDAKVFVTYDTRIFNGTKIPAGNIIKTGQPVSDWIEKILNDEIEEPTDEQEPEEGPETDIDLELEEEEEPTDNEEEKESGNSPVPAGDFIPTEEDINLVNEDPGFAQILATKKYIDSAPFNITDNQEILSSDLLKDLILNIEEDIVGEHLFGLMAKERQIAGINQMNKMQLRIFKRGLAMWWKSEYPDLSKPVYEQACRILGGNPATDLKWNSDPDITGNKPIEAL